MRIPTHSAEKWPTVYGLVAAAVCSLLLSPLAHAGPACSDVFQTSATALNHAVAGIEIKFSADFPEVSKATVSRVLERVTQIATGLKLPRKLTFSSTTSSLHEIGFANMETNSVSLMREAFSLSPKSFDALLAHEITHLLVVQNFHSSNGVTLSKVFASKNDDSFEKMTLSAAHMPFAELLCDTMGVLVTNDPKAFVTMIDEIAVLGPKFKKFKEANSLSRRDFSLDPTADVWADYEPKDFVYNRMNQIRAHAWTHYFSGRSPEQQQTAFVHLVQALEPLVRSNSYDVVTMQSSVFEANEELITYLDQTMNSAHQ